MASSAPASTLFHSLQPRPPTPPREVTLPEQRSQPPASIVQNRSSPLNPRHSLHTPPNVNTPASGPDTTNSNGSAVRAGKRVGWSGQNEYYKDQPNRQIQTKPYKSSPLSAPQPLKSILKPSSSPTTFSSSLAVHVNGQAQENITEMLDSTIKQLAGTDTGLKKDAYIALSNALKASNNLPDRVALQDKMSLFTQFIQRDIVAKEEDGAVGASLVIRALTLLATFLQFQAIATTITSDFAVFIIDYCIRSFDDPSLSKDVIRHMMQVVALQRFSAKVMTLDRVGRLVSSLHKIENHHAGKSIVMKRLHIYKSLVSQSSRSHMAVHGEWLKDVFTDMLSNIKDIQNQAIILGMDAGYSLRSGAQMLRKAMEILQTAGNNQTYVEFYIQRLQEMLRDKQRSPAVPKIWTVMSLFLRCRLEKWEYYGPWFSLIQTAFNSSDINTKLEANYAWNRYAFVSLVDNGVSQKTLSALCQPLLSQLRRKPNPKNPEDGVKLRKTVIGGICTLYYYAFRPGNDRTAPPPELIWDHAVHPVMVQLLNLEGARDAQRPDDILQASRILIGLLNVSTPVVWREDRIMESQPVKPDELPSIESKWIRRNSIKVFKVIGPILEKKLADVANKESLVHRLWISVIGSIAAASAKDIKVSDDTITFLAGMLGFLSHVWSKGCPGEEKTQTISHFYASIRVLITTTVQALGLLPFTEKKLSVTMSNTFEPVATPSQRAVRSDHSRGTVRDSLSHLFVILSSIPEGGADDDEFAEFFQAIFEPFLTAKNGRKEIGITRDLLRLLPENTLCPYAPWMLGAQAMRASIITTSSSSASEKDKIWGPEFREITSHLVRGLTLHPKLPMDAWLSLFHIFSERVTQELGDAGRALTMTEPLSKTLLDNFQSDPTASTVRTLEMVVSVAATAKLPRDKQALSMARRRLWGSVAAQKGSSSDPFEYFYKLVNLALRKCYEVSALRESAASQLARLITTVDAFLESTCSTGVFAPLSKLEVGLSPWLEDGQGVLSLASGSPISDALRQLWSRLCDLIANFGRLEKQQLDQISVLFAPAFKSRNGFIVNKTAETWNYLARNEDELEISDSLRSIVSSLRSKVDLIVPGNEESSGEFGAQTTAFIESQEAVVLSTATSNDHEPQPVVSITKKGPQGFSLRRQLGSTPEQSTGSPANKRSTRSNKAGTARLRHDNSQIQFEPIPDSPIVNEESQHLTERQKEIRERQDKTAIVYSDMHTTSPIQSVAASSNQEAAEDTSREGELPTDTTPVKASVYKELISSTPTPRRGQMMPMEVDNDPPSSPPEPRPYPLLSEIRSRSRANSSLENWEFSSPPSSPVASRQHVAAEVDPPHITMTDDSTQFKPVIQTRLQKAREGQNFAVPAKHNSADERGMVDEVSAENLLIQETPKTPQRSVLRSALPESPKSGEDDFVDARSNPDRSSPMPVASISNSTHEAPSNSKDTSFALSEGDESRLMKFIVELETRHGGESLHEDPAVPQKGAVEECITVRADSSSEGEGDAGTAAEPVHEIIPSTPLEEPTESQGSGKKRKRKRGSKASESRRKKRKSIDDTLPSQVEEDKSQISRPSPTTPQHNIAPVSAVGVRTRRSARKEEERQRQAVQTREAKDEVDTDEELTSQIISESYAASSSQHAMDSQQSEMPSVIEDSMDKGGEEHIDDVKEGEDDGAGYHLFAAENKANHIMEMLKGGVVTLQDATLSRTDVNKIEDMLMDMKRALYAAEQRGRESH